MLRNVSRGYEMLRNPLRGAIPSKFPPKPDFVTLPEAPERKREQISSKFFIGPLEEVSQSKNPERQQDLSLGFCRMLRNVTKYYEMLRNRIS